MRYAVYAQERYIGLTDESHVKGLLSYPSEKAKELVTVVGPIVDADYKNGKLAIPDLKFAEDCRSMSLEKFLRAPVVDLKSWRATMGLSLATAADYLKVSKSTVQRYERGTHRVPAKVLKRMAA